MTEVSGISEQGPARPEAWIVNAGSRTGICGECRERVEPHHEVLLGFDDDPLIHAECSSEEVDDE